MSEDTKCCLIIAGAFVSVFASLIWAIALCNMAETAFAEKAVENGYQQKVEGLHVLWVKENAR